MKTIKNEIEKQYDICVKNITVIPTGIAAATYLVDSNRGKYIFKSCGDNEYVQNEPVVAECLRGSDIPVAEYIPTTQGRILWRLDENICFMQSYIDGVVYGYHCAPSWFMRESARMLGRIHASLASISPLPVGMGEDFVNYMFSPQPAIDYEETLKIAVDSNDEEIASHIVYRLSQIKKLNKHKLDFGRLTRKNTHGDYKISNLICGDQRIRAVIDLSSACIHPVVWEVIRSFVYAQPGCRDGEIDIQLFIDYVREYTRFSDLTRYDLTTMPFYFYYQILVSNYYGQYYGTCEENKEDVMNQALLSTKLIKWFDKNIDELSSALIHAV